jgi:hypothetical protein
MPPPAKKARQPVDAFGPAGKEQQEDEKKAKARSTSATVFALVTSPIWVPLWLLWQLAQGM